MTNDTVCIGIGIGIDIGIGIGIAENEIKRNERNRIRTFLKNTRKKLFTEDVEESKNPREEVFFQKILR